MLNRIWLGFFFVSGAAAVYQSWGLGNTQIFEQMVKAMFDMTKLSVDIAIGLVGGMCLWLGVMRVAQVAGLVDKLAWALGPLFQRLMPQVPKGHPAIGSVTMNLSANVLGLDNAATPLGIKAMKDLQSLNPDPLRATNAQILFLVLNTSSVTLFPISVFIYRAQLGASDPTDVFVPILLATSASTLAGLLCVGFWQKLKLCDWVVLAYLGTGFALIGAILVYFLTLSAAQVASYSAFIANLSLLAFVLGVFAYAGRRINVYEHFIEGAKEGFSVAINIIPYLIAMLVAIALLRSSGVLESVIQMIASVANVLGMDTRFVEGLPTALMQPLSGSGARAMMLETMQTHGADSFAGRLSSVIQGSTETTFYVLAVYFGAVGVRYTRHALSCGLLADLAGVIAAISVCYLFFG